MPNNSQLQWLWSIFLEAWEGLELSGNPQFIFNSVIKRYTEASRKYHNCDHILHCLVLLQLSRSHITYDRSFYLLVFALFYHDVFYDPQYSRNEEMSAIMASTVLAHAGLSEEDINRVYDYIVATKHNFLTEDFNTQLICDIDLASLGIPQEQYDANTRKIREEYSMYTKEEFLNGREAFSKAFLARPSIYQTKEFQERYEKRAWENIVVSLAWLPQCPWL